MGVAFRHDLMRVRADHELTNMANGCQAALNVIQAIPDKASLVRLNYLFAALTNQC